MDFSSGQDTIRRDWLIIIVGLFAGVWFFYDFGNHHPFGQADASLGKNTVESTGLEWYTFLGYQTTDPTVNTTFKTRPGLLNQLQQQSPAGSPVAVSESDNAFSPWYWSLQIYQPDLQDHDGELQTGFEAPFLVELVLNERGEWLEFRNQNGRPQRLLMPDALARAFELPDELLAEARDDSVLLSRFSFDFDRELQSGESLLEDDRVIIDQNHAKQIASWYLEQSAWPIDYLSFETARILPEEEFDLAELSYRITEEELDLEAELHVRISPGGSLISMVAVYPEVQAGTIGVALAVRYLFMLVFGVWLVIMLYIRTRLRVIDIRPGILLAVLAGMATPFTILMLWLNNVLAVPMNPGWISFIFILLSMGVMAAIVSVLFFTVTVNGESITRQNWPEKIRTLDLIRIGHFLNRPLGTVFIHAVAFAFMLAAAWSAILWFLPEAHFTLEEQFFADRYLLAPIVHLLVIFFFSLITIQAIHLVLIGQVANWKKSRFLTVFLSLAVFAFIAPIQVDTGYLAEEAILHGMVGLGLGIIYVYRDFLTTFLTYFLFTLLITTAGGWLMIDSPDVLNFYLSAGVGILFLIFGYIAVTRGKSIQELPKYVPEYIEDLAQEERIKQELQIARKVQQSFLPIRQPDLPGLDLAAACIPAYETGGDYYDFIELQDGRIALIVGDVSGKGFQAAFYMTFIKGVLHALCQEHTSTVTILKKANKLFHENARRGTFISLIFGILDLEKKTFLFSRAGHNPVLYYSSKERRLRVIRPNGLALGMTDGEVFKEQISETSIDLQEGDMLIFFTDGIVEAVNSRNEMYGDKRLHRLAIFHQDKPAQEILDAIFRDVEKFSEGEHQHDDMTLLVIKSESTTR